MGLYISEKVIDRTLEEVLRAGTTIGSFVLAGAVSQIPVSVAKTALAGVYAHLAGRTAACLMGKIASWDQRAGECRSRTCRKIDQFIRSRTFAKLASFLVGQGSATLLGGYLLFMRGTESEVLTEKDFNWYMGSLYCFLAFSEWVLNGGANRICRNRDREEKALVLGALTALGQFVKHHGLADKLTFFFYPRSSEYPCDANRRCSKGM